MEIENTIDRRHDKDEELMFNDFLDTLKTQVVKLKANKLLLSGLNTKKIELHQTQKEQYDKLLELQRNIKDEQLKNGKVRDEIMYLDQCIHLKRKVVAAQDLDLVEASDKIRNAFNNYLNSLNMKLKFKQKCVLNEKIINFEVIVNTAEVCLVYDILSEQFDLISLHPTHPKFDEIRMFLIQSADVSGLLASVYLWTSTTRKINELDS